MKLLRTFSFASLAMLMAGCALLQIEKPQSFNERVAYGVSLVSAARESINADLNAGRIGSADAQTYLDRTDTARSSLDAANRIGDTPEGQRNIEIAREVLAFLRAERPGLFPLDTDLSKLE